MPYSSRSQRAENKQHVSSEISHVSGLSIHSHEFSQKQTMDLLSPESCNDCKCNVRRSKEWLKGIGSEVGKTKDFTFEGFENLSRRDYPSASYLATKTTRNYKRSSTIEDLTKLATELSISHSPPPKAYSLLPTLAFSLVS